MTQLRSAFNEIAVSLLSIFIVSIFFLTSITQRDAQSQEPICRIIQDTPFEPPQPHTVDSNDDGDGGFHCNDPNQAPVQVLNSPTADTYRMCLYNGSNAVIFNMQLPGGQTFTSQLQEGSCRDVTYTSLSIGPSCWGIPIHGKPPPCTPHHYHRHCEDGTPYPDFVTWSAGWADGSILTAQDKILTSTAYFSYSYSTFRSKPASILMSTDTRTVNVCLNPIGTTMYYDENDPFGSSRKTFVTTLPCTTITAKAIWINSRYPVKGTYQVFY
jgi:hypothetical protein